MTPTGSCPRTSPGFTGYSPRTMCTSVPQIVVAVILMTASPGPGLGFGTSSMAIWFVPLNTTAFMVFMFGLRGKSRAAPFTIDSTGSNPRGKRSIFRAGSFFASECGIFPDIGTRGRKLPESGSLFERIKVGTRLAVEAGVNLQKRLKASIEALACCALLATQTATPLAQTPIMKLVMRDKLANAQQLLGFVVRADYGGISRSAEQLSRISETEIASWQAVNQPQYFQQATRFLLSVKGLREAAAKQDSAEAAQEYITLVSTCVECHTFVRGTQTASLKSGQQPGTD